MDTFIAESSLGEKAAHGSLFPEGCQRGVGEGLLPRLTGRASADW